MLHLRIRPELFWDLDKNRMSEDTSRRKINHPGKLNSIGIKMQVRNEHGEPATKVDVNMFHASLWAIKTELNVHLYIIDDQYFKLKQIQVKWCR